MGVSIFVMPLGTWLQGNFAPTWPREGPFSAAPRRRRSEVEARRALEAFSSRLEGLLGSRPEWDESGPIRSATTMSVDGFSRPFQKARQWSFRLALPRLGAMEPPQIWIPLPFDPVLEVAAPWNGDAEVSVASSSGMEEELGRLLGALEREPGMEELQGLPEGTPITGMLAEFYADLRTTRRLREIAGQSVDHRVPVIIEA